MAKGNLIVELRNANGALPLQDAKVTVMDEQGNVITSLLTDENGTTPSISLDTVDHNLALDPNYKGNPYTSYNLLIEAPGFNSLHISGVHIFDGQTALQPVSLIPMLRTQSAPKQYDIDLTEPSVESSEPRNQVGPVFQPFTLRHVVIPDPITVHLGAPTAAASNVQVSFPDYVKNVASSEIYPTWPQAALEANIYAIITFALNRVYTEWYRNKGYNFDITNSTAVDQSFQYGRTIYESISRIVDSIYNQYVRRQGQIAPFFTSFCNGTTVTCSGMSQWGTVNLANQGMSALEILRSYYPKDVEIAETNIITNIVTSYPGTPLQSGNSGQNVEIMQNYLNRIRRNYPAIPQITDAAGQFGPTTLAAVKQFQSIFNLAADGVIGPATWNKISSIYAAVTKLSGLDSEGTQIGLGTIPPSQTLMFGSTGNDVITLQYILSEISEYYPTIPAPSLNGRYDTATLESVNAFQRMMGLTADGIVGSSTWNALYETYWGIIDHGNDPDAPQPSEASYLVQPGDTLWLLAQRFGTTVDALRSLNHLTSDILYVGQPLQIPEDNAPPANTQYTVRNGDTLWILAQRFGTTVDAIIALNQLTSNILSIGQTLQIPTSSAPAQELRYSVQSGDTLWLLAQRFGTTVNTLRSLNNLTSDVLNLGQVLRIPQ